MSTKIKFTFTKEGEKIKLKKVNKDFQAEGATLGSWNYHESLHQLLGKAFECSKTAQQAIATLIKKIKK